MTTPQTVLYDIHHKINELIHHFEGTWDEDTEQREGSCLEDIKDILITVNRSMFAIERIRERLDGLNVDSMSERIEKFEENYRRFEVMFNEFKGIIAMTRANLKASQSET